MVWNIWHLYFQKMLFKFFFFCSFDVLKVERAYTYKRTHMHTHKHRRKHTRQIYTPSNIKYMKIFHAEFLWISEKWLPLMYIHLALWFDRFVCFNGSSTSTRNISSLSMWRKMLNHEFLPTLYHLMVCHWWFFTSQSYQTDCHRIVISHRCSDFHAIFPWNTCSHFRACWHVIFIWLKVNVFFSLYLRIFLVVVY